MKYSLIAPVVLFYTIWTVTLLAIFIMIPGLRLQILNIWLFGTIYIQMYLAGHFIHLACLKKKLNKRKEEKVL